MAVSGREASDASTGRFRRGSGGGTCGRGGWTPHGKPSRWRGTRRQPARVSPGRSGWRRGPQYRGSRVTPVEERDLSSRAAHDGGRDVGTGVSLSASERVQRLQTALHAKAKEIRVSVMPQRSRCRRAAERPARSCARNRRPLRRRAGQSQVLVDHGDLLAPPELGRSSGEVLLAPSRLAVVRLGQRWIAARTRRRRATGEWVGPCRHSSFVLRFRFGTRRLHDPSLHHVEHGDAPLVLQRLPQGRGRARGLQEAAGGGRHAPSRRSARRRSRRSALAGGWHPETPTGIGAGVAGTSASGPPDVGP